MKKEGMCGQIFEERSPYVVRFAQLDCQTRGTWRLKYKCFYSIAPDFQETDLFLLAAIFQYRRNIYKAL